MHFQLDQTSTTTRNIIVVKSNRRLEFTLSELVIFPAHALAAIQTALDELARSGIFIGTSSWKYPGWCGHIYDEQRYLTRAKFSEAKFECECLSAPSHPEALYEQVADQIGSF